MTYRQITQSPRRAPLLLELRADPLTHEQQQAVVAFAATMGNMNQRAGLVAQSARGTPALPGGVEVPGSTQLQPLVDEFLENQAARGRAEGTLTAYRPRAGSAGAICPELPVTAAHVRQAITKPGWAQGTVRLRFALIRCFLGEAQEKGHLVSPCWEIGRVDGGDVDIRILSLDEMKAVHAAAAAGAPHRKHRGLMARNSLMILFTMECGPRASDIAMMRASDVSDGGCGCGPRPRPVGAGGQGDHRRAEGADPGRRGVAGPGRQPAPVPGGRLRGELRPGTGRHIGRAPGSPPDAALLRHTICGRAAGCSSCSGSCGTARWP